MNVYNRPKPRVLIVDDNEMNREILSEMLGEEYDIVEAKNGAEAVAVLMKESVNISLVLLDIIMPVMDGYGVLQAMNDNHWIDDVPVIMISSDNSVSSMRKAYELGITEFISRPFDALIVRHRVVNTIMLYAKQKKLVSMVAEQMYEKEKDSRLMINILSHIVEFRNGESGMHVLHVQNFTEILLRQLMQITDKYNITEADINLISKASALHDIGKITVPDEILNKPGRLDPEEFEIMKKHSLAGAAMIDELENYKDEPLVKVAYQICRWHHERYDGRGYPDGLKGEEIPIAAQIVALADVYDALTSERVYKKAFSHEEALEMITGGQCGTFNPLLLECLIKASDAILKQKGTQDTKGDVIKRETLAVELTKYDELSSTEETLRLLNYERLKNRFFASISPDLHFEYSASPSIVTVYPNNSAETVLDELINDPLHDDRIRSMVADEHIKRLAELVQSTTPDNPVTEYSCPANINGTIREIKVTCRTVWNTNAEYMGTFGRLRVL